MSDEVDVCPLFLKVKFTASRKRGSDTVVISNSTAQEKFTARKDSAPTSVWLPALFDAVCDIGTILITQPPAVWNTDHLVDQLV